MFKEDILITKKHLVALVGLLFVIAATVPPWKIVSRNHTGDILRETHKCYSPIFSPPKIDSKEEFAISSIEIDMERHLLFLLTICLLGVIIIILYGEKILLIKKDIINSYLNNNVKKTEKPVSKSETLIFQNDIIYSYVLKNDSTKKILSVDELRNFIYAGLISTKDMCIEYPGNQELEVQQILERDQQLKELPCKTHEEEKLNQENIPNSEGNANELIKTIKKYPLISSLLIIGILLDISWIPNIYAQKIGEVTFAAPLSSLVVVYTVGLAFYIKSLTNLTIGSLGAFVYCSFLYLGWIFIHIFYGNTKFHPSILFLACLLAAYRILKDAKSGDIYRKIFTKAANFFYVGVYLLFCGFLNLMYLIFISSGKNKFVIYVWAIVLTINILGLYKIYQGYLYKKMVR
jgi:hypothetical protein